MRLDHHDQHLRPQAGSCSLVPNRKTKMGALPRKSEAMPYIISINIKNFQVRSPYNSYLSCVPVPAQPCFSSGRNWFEIRLQNREVYTVQTLGTMHRSEIMHVAKSRNANHKNIRGDVSSSAGTRMMTKPIWVSPPAPPDPISHICFWPNVAKANVGEGTRSIFMSSIHLYILPL